MIFMIVDLDPLQGNTASHQIFGNEPKDVVKLREVIGVYLVQCAQFFVHQKDVTDFESKF
jgi:hypothetical protein